MEQGYYSPIETPREALYEAACAMDSQDVPLEDWPVKLIAALGRSGFAVVPVELPHDVLGRAAIAGVAETGNPKHAWDFLLERLAVVEEENRRLRAVIEEVHSWAVCACFATPEDMAENFPRIVEITIPNTELSGGEAVRSNAGLARPNLEK